MQREILVPLDGSALAEVVLPHALTLASAPESSLTLLQVLTAVASVERLMWPAGAVAVNLFDSQAERSGAQEYLESTAGRLASSGVPITKEIREGDPAQAILAYTHEHAGIVQIAMATHGRSGVDRWIMGSVAEKLLHAAPTPLLLVHTGDPPPDLTAAEYRTILVPLDGSAFAEQAIGDAQALAIATRATLLLVAVLPPASNVSLAEAGLTPFWLLEARDQETRRIARTLEATAEHLSARRVAVRTRIMYGIPADEILRGAAEEHADLILMATHGRGGLNHFWIGSVALKIVRAGTLPVLLLGPGRLPAGQQVHPEFAAAPR